MFDEYTVENGWITFKFTLNDLKILEYLIDNSSDILIKLGQNFHFNDIDDFKHFINMVHNLEDLDYDLTNIINNIKL